MKPSVYDVVVIIPTVMFDHMLDEAVNSILADEYEKFRLLVVGDGVAPAEEREWFADERVTIRVQPRRLGIAATLRQAVAGTDEPFIARLDADDRSIAGRLGIQAEYLRQHQDAVLVGGLAARFRDDGTDLGTMGQPAGPDIRNQLVRHNSIVHSSVMYRRSAYEASGGYNPERKVMSDYDLWLRMARLGPFAVLPRVVAGYRLHAGQITRTARPFSRDVREITSLRWALARSLGYSPPVSLSQMARWNVAQLLYYTRLRKRSIDRAARQGITRRVHASSE